MEQSWLRLGVKVRCGGGHRGKMGCRHKRVCFRSRKSVVGKLGSAGTGRREKTS